jgi:hypothetical protein
MSPRGRKASYQDQFWSGYRICIQATPGADADGVMEWRDRAYPNMDRCPSAIWEAVVWRISELRDIEAASESPPRVPASCLSHFVSVSSPEVEKDSSAALLWVEVGQHLYDTDRLRLPEEWPPTEHIFHWNAQGILQVMGLVTLSWLGRLTSHPRTQEWASYAAIGCNQTPAEVRDQLPEWMPYDWSLYVGDAFSRARATSSGATAGRPSSATAPAAGWFPDPKGRHQFRYWDGESWAAHVSDNGQTALDPM